MSSWRVPEKGQMTAIDERYFQHIDGEAKAYWLGFLTADGSVRWNKEEGNYSVCLGLKASDGDHIGKLESALGSNREPLIETRKFGISARLTWYSKALVKDLIDHGVGPRKSTTDYELPTIRADIEHHYWRGVFDGDGCLAVQRKSPTLAPEYRFSLAGRKCILVGFQKWARRSCSMRPQKIVRAANQNGLTRAHVFYVSGNRQIEVLLSELYFGATSFLERKYRLYHDLIVQNSVVIPSYRRVYILGQEEGLAWMP